MNLENIQVKGHIFIDLFDENGVLKDYREVDNVVVTVGKTFLATWLAAASQAGAFMPYIGIGTGTTAAAAGDTALQTEQGTRVAGAETTPGSTNIWQNQATFPANNPVAAQAITESGLFSASSAGTMFAHQVFSAINKATADSLQITWQITFS